MRNLHFLSKRCFSQASETQLKRTTLYDFHKSHGGKLVDFAGFEMPVQYKNLSISESTLHTRQSSSLFDVSHMGQLNFFGKDRVAFLEHLLVSNVSALKLNQVKYSLMLNKNGGVIDDLVFANRDSYHYMVINAGRITEDLAHIDNELSAFKGDCNYDFLAEDALVALQGPASVAVLSRLIPEFDFTTLKFFYLADLCVQGINVQVSRSGYTGEDGFEIAVANRDVIQLCELLINETEVEFAGLGARDSLRLEAGLCLYGNDLNESITPIEADLAWTMSKKRQAPECVFVGSEVVHEQIQNGSALKRVGVIADKGLSPRAHMRILNANDEDIGEITSGGFSPCLQKPIGMGYIQANMTEIGTGLKVLIRDAKTIDVQVCALPFVKKGYFK